MTRQPYLCVWIHSRDIAIKVLGSRIVSILLGQALLETSEIAGVSALSTVTNLPREATRLLAATTTEEKVIILLVIGGRTLAIPNREGCSFQAYDDRGVAFVDI